MLLSTTIQPMVPVCYHPMTVVYLDDDKTALQSMKLLLEDNFPTKLFSNPLEALDFLNHRYNEKPFTTRCFEQELEPSRDQRLIGADFAKIHHELYRPQRFQPISTIIIDYAMPEMNGLEFVQKLKNNKFKIVMLTGEADKDTVIEAFNNGLIHSYLRKDAENIADSLLRLISSSQKDYFSFYSLPLITSLATNEERPINTLTDPAYINLVNKIINEHGIIEYYVTEALGSLVMLDRKGTPSWLALRDEEEMQGLLYHAELLGASNDILDDMKTARMLPYFFSDEDFRAPPQTWRTYLHPAQPLEGTKKYLYAYITDPKAYKIKRASFISFNEYLNISL